MTIDTGSAEKRVIAGRYEIIKPVGQGGMSKVYLGKDTSLNRTVAIKLLREELVANPDFVMRFQREARVVAALPDDYIPGIYDYGQEGNTYYIITEFIDGPDLKKLIQQRGKLSAERATEITEQLLYALKAAHAFGLVHRDVKPQNILVRNSDGRIKLADFGVARARDAAADPAQATAAGTVIGTAAYMSPEQARGEEVGPPTDLYAAGIVLYEMLTGELPYRGDSTIETLMAHIHQPIPDLRRFPPYLANVIYNALAKEPNQRYQTADEMLKDLKNPTEEEPTAYIATNQPPYSAPTQINYTQPTLPPVQPSYAPPTVNQVVPTQPSQPPQAYTYQNSGVNNQYQAVAPIQQYQTPPARTTPAEPSKVRRNWFWPLLLGGLLIGAIAFLVYTLLPAPNLGTSESRNPTATVAAAKTTVASATTVAAGQKVNIKIAPDQLDGAYERDDKTLFGRQTRALYGAGSGYNEGRVTLNLPAAPEGQLSMRIIGLDDERDPERCELEIIINGKSIYKKNNFFPNTPRTDNGVGGGDRYWGDMVVTVPVGSLKAGNNTIIFRNNAEWSGKLGIPYMLINNIFIS